MSLPYAPHRPSTVQCPPSSSPALHFSLCPLQPAPLTYTQLRPTIFHPAHPPPPLCPHSLPPLPTLNNSGHFSPFHLLSPSPLPSSCRLPPPKAPGPGARSSTSSLCPTARASSCTSSSPPTSPAPSASSSTHPHPPPPTPPAPSSTRTRATTPPHPASLPPSFSTCSQLSSPAPPPLILPPALASPPSPAAPALRYSPCVRGSRSCSTRCRWCCWRRRMGEEW